MHFEAERGGRGGLPFHLVPPLLVASEPQATIHLPPGGQAGFGFEGAIQLDGVTQQLGDVCAGTQLTNQASSVERGAGCELVALDEEGIGPAEFGQVVGG